MFIVCYPCALNQRGSHLDGAVDMVDHNCSTREAIITHCKL